VGPTAPSASGPTNSATRCTFGSGSSIVTGAPFRKKDSLWLQASVAVSAWWEVDRRSASGQVQCVCGFRTQQHNRDGQAPPSPTPSATPHTRAHGQLGARPQVVPSRTLPPPLSAHGCGSRECANGTSRGTEPKLAQVSRSASNHMACGAELGDDSPVDCARGLPPHRRGKGSNVADQPATCV
jgi:hypothetical protein